MKTGNRPVVLVFGGNDPSGGAGLSADIEAIASHGCRAAPVVTCLTVQDSHDVSRVETVQAELIQAQARAILADMPVAAIKIGLLARRDSAEAIREMLVDWPELPVICDPVLSSGGSGRAFGDDMGPVLRESIVPQSTIITPNLPEIRRLAPEAEDADRAARALLDEGCELVLLTGTHDATDSVVNRLYGSSRPTEQYVWERLPDSYHGSGCTLASSIAALLARGVDPWAAVHEAQVYAWQSLRNGERPGGGQYLPNRFYWAAESADADG